MNQYGSMEAESKVIKSCMTCVEDHLLLPMWHKSTRAGWNFLNKRFFVENWLFQRPKHSHVHTNRYLCTKQIFMHKVTFPCWQIQIFEKETGSCLYFCRQSLRHEPPWFCISPPQGRAAAEMLHAPYPGLRAGDYPSHKISPFAVREKKRI